MKFLGKDPESNQGSSPTIWDDGDDYVIQGWRIETRPHLPRSARCQPMRTWCASPSG